MHPWYLGDVASEEDVAIEFQQRRDMMSAETATLADDSPDEMDAEMFDDNIVDRDISDDSEGEES